MACSKLTGNLQDYRDTLANKDAAIQQLTDEAAVKQAKITEMQNSLEKLDEESQDQGREIKLLTMSLDEADRNLKLEKETGV
jgi:peptidoglycan hydrolase CwlO-like protein